MKTYLITGAAGFIGSHVADNLLSAGHKVVNIDNFNDYYDINLKEENVKPHFDNGNYKLERIDIRDLVNVDRVFAENDIDTVIHLAARAGVRPSIENPILYQEVNCRGTQNVLECCKKYEIKSLVSASSSSVYGNNKDVPFKETDVVDFAISPYAASKKANEVMGHVYHKLYKINIAFLRFFTVYGPRQRPDLAINKFTRLILNDEEIPMFGDGTTSRDYTYIDNIVDGILKAVDLVEQDNTIYEIFNIGSSNPVSLIDMIKTIEKATGKTAKIKRLPMQQGDVDRTYADISKLKEMTGYNPSLSFEEGCKRFLDWYLSKRLK